MRIIRSIRRLVVPGLALLALSSVWLLPPSHASAQEPNLPLISIRADQTSVAEGQDATFTLTRTGSTSAELPVRVYSIEFFHPDGSGSLDNPTGQYHEVTFDGGSDSATLTVTVDFDGVQESSDSLNALISPEEGSLYRNGDPSQASVAITDVARMVTIAAGQTTVMEGDTATFTLTRTGPTTKAVVVNISVTDPGSFLRGNHWRPDPVLPTEATFEADSSTTMISLSTKDDLRDIPDNNLTVTVNPGTGYSIVSDANSASISVTDNDVAPTLQLSIDSDSVEEGETLTITVQLTGGSQNPVEYAVVRGYEGETEKDYSGFDGDETVGSWSIDTDDNDLDEEDRVYRLEIVSAIEVPEGAQSEYWTIDGPSSVSATVRDNDLPLVWIEPQASSYPEYGFSWFRLHRVGRTDHDLEVMTKTTQAGHDVDPFYWDYLDRTRVYTIDTSSDFENIAWVLAGNDGDEDEGALTIQLLESSDYRIDPARSSASFRVVDLDPPPTLSIENARVSGSEDSGFIKFTVSLDAEHASRRTVTVDYATTDGSAEAGSDYTETSGVLTLDPLETTGVISVPVTDDNLAESGETFTLTLSNLSNAVLANELTLVSATGTIDDNEPTVSIAARAAEVTEGAPVVFDLTRTGSAENELTVILGVLALGGLELGDKVQRVTFATGDARAAWEHATADNDADEPDRQVIAALTPPSSSGLPETYHVNQAIAGVTVKDNDLPLVTIAAAGSDQTEGEDVEFTLTRRGVLSDPLTVSISVTGGDDFITGTRPATAAFATGAATRTLTLTTVDDAPVDDDGEVAVEVTSGSGYRVGDPGSAAVALFDSTRSYPVVSIRADKGVVDEGDDVVFTLSRSAYGLDESLTVRVRVSVTTSSPESLSDGVDVAVSNEEVVFDAGSLTASLVRATVDEALNDGNSAVWAVIQLGQYSIRPYPGEAVVWVRDDDIPTVTATPETGEVLENPPNATEFTVARTGDTTNWLRLRVLTWQDRRWPEEVLDPDYAVFVEESSIPRIRDRGVQDFQPGQTSKTFTQEPRGTGPLGTTAYFEVLPFYCGDDVPGDCGYRPQYQVGTPKSSTIEVLNRDMGVRVVADQASVDEGDPASFTLHRYGGTFITRASSLTVRVQVTQNGEFIDGVPPQTVTFAGAPVDPSTNEGDTTAVVTIPTTNDMVDEANGAIILTILGPDPELYGDNAHSYEVFDTETFLENSGWTNVATVEVLDNDVAGFSVADASADEADGTLQFTVTIPGSTLETSVDWATKEDAAGDDPATEGQDYEAASGTLTFAPGDTSKTFTVTLNDDDVKEKDETFAIQLSNPVNAALTDASAIGTIEDDDLSQAVFITMDAETADGVEEGEDVVFNLERHTWLDGALSQEVARGRLVVGLEITLEGDFVRAPVPATAVFEAGVWVATVTVPTIDDALFEPAGSVSLKLESQGFGLLSNADPVEADVYDNDMPVSIADAQADEGDGEITFTISLQGPAVTPIEVEVVTVDGGATSHGVVTATDFGKDFTAKSETLTFAVGEQTKQFAVTLADDRWDEAAESFTVELSDPSYARLQDASATGTILDDDPQLEATLVAPENKRIDEDTIYPVRLVVELDDSQSLASERSAYLNWTVTPDTATHGEDYVEAGGRIVIPPGHLTGSFEIHLVDDDLFEQRNELFTVTLTRDRWVLVDPDNSSRIIKIKDDEILSAAVVAANANVVEGSDATFRIWVSGSRHTEDVVVQYETGGTATSGDDYTAPSGTVTIPVGQQSVPIDIGTTADSLHDPNETLVITLTDVTSVGRTVRSNAETRTATVTILDEGALVVSVEGDEGTEGNVLRLTVTLSSTTDAPVEVQWTTEQYGSLLPLDERATAGADYESGGGTLTILPGEDTGTILVATKQDALAENTERFLVKLTGASRVPDAGVPENVALGAFSAEGSILDDDVAPTAVTLSATPATVPENADQTQLAITATLNTTTALTEDATVQVSIADGSAKEGEDYTASTVTLIIAAGDLSRTGTLNLTPLDDEIAEGDETVQITGTTDGLDVTPTEVTIADDDKEPTGITLRVTPNSVGEGDGDTVLNVKAVLTGGDRRPVDTTVTLSMEGAALPADGGGTTTAASADDFSFSPVLLEGSEVPPGQITLTIPAGEGDATAQLTLALVDDLIVEGDETAQVSGTAIGLPVALAPLTITDNDRDPTGIQLSVTPWDLVEGEGSPVLLVTATLTGGGARTADTQVSLSVHGLSAVAGEDYRAPSNVTLTIPAESLTGSTTLTLTLLDDDISEDSEELEVRGTNAAPGLPVGSALIAIDDNDNAPTGVTLTLDKDRVPEDAGLQQLTVTGVLTGGGKRTVDTTVTLTVSNVTATDADYTYLPAELTIPSGQAEGAGMLLLVPTDDLVDEDDETLEVRGVVPGLTVSPQQVVITDNDSAGVTITPTSLTVLESQSNRYSVKLNTQPTADVTVAIGGHAGTALTLSGTTLASDSLTFTSENWSTPQTVAVNAGAVTADTDVTLVHGISGGDYGSITAADVAVTVVDIPENQVTIQVGVTLSRQALTVPEGGSNTYEVVLGHQPTGDVTVTVTVDDTANNDVTTEEGSLVFTTANWNEPQTVTVRAAEDDDALTDSGVTISHTVGGANYEGVIAPGLTVTITENDADGVTISPTTLTVTEGDAAGASYTVVLTSQPAGDVTVAISGHSGTDLSISGTTLSGDDELTFTTANWGTAQTVTVKAAEDGDAVTDADVTLAHAISSTDDSVYNALAGQSVTVSITENDAVGVTINPTTLTVTEGDAAGASYTVVLASQPAGDVTIAISGHAGTDLTVSGTTLTNNVLTFTTENWGTAQTVKVEAAEDGDATTDPDVTLVHEISSADDSAYDALAGQSVTVSITENDADGVTINPTTLTVTEGDAAGASYTVVLTSQPAGDVTVAISGHAGTDLTVSGTTLTNNVLTFTTENWGTAQTVKVEAAEDGDATTDPDVTLVHEISSADDTVYNALAGQSVTVSITENDADGVTISPTTLTVTEGEATGVSYTVVLTSQPAGDVTITISGHSGTDLALSGTTLTSNELTFTTENWGTAQTVKVEAAEDGDATTDPDVTLVHEISSADDTVYNALAGQSVTVSITENDAVGVTINPTTLTVTEGDAAGASYTVVLTSQPAGDVTITISGHSGTDLALSGTTLTSNELTFTTENWGTAQTVKVEAAEDGDATTDPDVTLVHEISSADDTVYNALAGQRVTVSITENDAVGVTINPTTLTVTEGDAAGASYTVVLASQPAGDVTIAISGHAGTDLTVSGTTLTNNVLTFTTENWGTAQTVKVEAAEDGDATTDPDVTLVHEISSADDSVYNALAGQSVTVSITENDGSTVTVSFEKEVHYTIEGASGVAGVEVLLSAPLQTEVTIPITVLSQSTADSDDYLVDDNAGYASDPGLTFSPGETFGYVFIKAVLDTIDENMETVVLGFGTLPAGVSEGSPNRSTVEIRDAIQVSFADSSYMVQEGGPGVEVMVRLNKPRNNLRVPLTANGQGGADDSDFTGVPQEVVFKDSKTEKTFTVVAIEDSEDEDGEMVRLAFGALSEGIVAIFPDSAMVMIDDSAGAPDSAMVMIDDAAAPAPRHFSASWPTQTSITVTWFTVETAAEYKLEFRKQGETDWTRISGEFDHLPSTSDHRDAFGMAAGLECETRYDFRVSARGSGEARNDGRRYSDTRFGSHATTSAQTGECAQVEQVTNLLVSVEPVCATLTWTPPSGGRDTGYRVERYSYTDNRNHRSEPETLLEQPNRVSGRYQDCSAAYRTDGAEHVYIVTALDNNPEPDEEGAFGEAYTSLLVYGPSWEPEGPRNVHLTHDTRSSRGLAWDAPRDRWLTTVKTARAGFGRQQVTLNPWTTGYRVERREYRRTGDGGWFLKGDWDTLRDETDGDTGTSFTDSEDKGDKQYVYRVWAYNNWGRSRYSWRGDWAFNGGDPGGDPEPAQQQGGETPSNTPATGLLAISGTAQVEETLTVDTSGISDADGMTNPVFTYRWVAGGVDVPDETGPSYTIAEDDVGLTIQVWVSFTDDAGNPEAMTSGATVAVIATVPSAPLGLTVTTGSQIQELDASWQAPSSNGGSAVTGYRVQWKEAADSWDTAADVSQTTVTGTTHTITGLTGGVEYAVRVMATNGAGDGPASAEARGTPAAENNAPTGLPGISGTAQVGETLTASTSNIEDEDGLGNVSYRYQWVRSDGTDDADIAGETSSTYALVEADQGQTIRVKVSFTDDAENDESLTSAATETVLARPNRPAAGLPTISGTPQVEQTLTADTSGISDGDGLTNVSYAHQWSAGGSDIDGATGSTYTLTASEQGQTIQVQVTFTDDANNEETLTSQATVAVAAAPNRDATGAPTIGGTPQVGETLTADTAGITDADGLTNVSYEYQWSTGGTDIPGATGASFTLTASEEGKTIQVQVTFTDDTDHDESLTSAATETVLARPNRAAAGLPTISGTPQVDETLTADTSAISDEDGLTNVSWSYQWTAGGTDIEGATSSTFTDDRGSNESLTSVATLAVAAAPNRDATGKPTIGGTPQVDQTLTADTSPIADEDGLTNATFEYQWIAGGSDIGGATGSTYTLTASEQGKTIQVQVTFTDDRGNAESLTSVATDAVAAKPAPLTVSLKTAAPTSHDGSSEFTFEIEFSEEFGLGYATLKNHAFNVTGGSVERAQRTDKPSNIPWRITVKPHGAGDVTIELPATTDCGATGAICTQGGRKLSNSLSFTVSGPGG